MKVGFNTNIPYKGKTYHVQTEDCGLSNPHILTLLYYEGAILASRRTSYEPFIGRPDCSQKIQELMNIQHKLMMKELIAGKHTGGGTLEESKTEEKSESRPASKPAQNSQPESGDAGRAASPETAKTGDEAQPQPETEMKKEKIPASDKGQIVNSLDDVLINFILRNRQE